MRAWVETRLKYLSAIPITNGLGEAGTHEQAEWPRYVRTTDIAGPRSLRDDVFASLPPAIAAPAALVKGDIIATAAGATIGKSCTFLEDYPACYAGFLVRFRPGPAVDGRFIAYWMQSLDYWEQINANAVRSTIDNFSASKYRDLSLRIPPLEEQRRIADLLDNQVACLDGAISLRQKQIDLLSESLEAALEEVWLGAGPTERKSPLDVPRDEEVRAGWTSAPLSRFLTRITYGFTNPMPSEEDGPYLLTANDIGNGKVNYDTARHTSELAFSTLITDKCRPRRGDVLLTKDGTEDGTLGRVAEADGSRACINQSVALLQPAPGFADGSLSEVLQVRAYRDALVFNAGGSAIKHLYIGRVAKQHVALPPLGQRTAVVAQSRVVRETHNDAIRSLNLSLALLHERKQVLITAAVTGQFDVTTARIVA